MIFVDTSVWVAAARKPSGPLALALQSLLDADEVALPLPVRIELLAGTPARHVRALQTTLSALPLSVPTEDTWRIINGWVRPAADKGYRFGMADYLVAALAHEHGGLVWSLDRDFDAMQDLGFVQLYS